MASSPPSSDPLPLPLPLLLHLHAPPFAEAVPQAIADRGLDVALPLSLLIAVAEQVPPIAPLVSEIESVLQLCGRVIARKTAAQQYRARLLEVAHLVHTVLQTIGAADSGDVGIVSPHTDKLAEIIAGSIEFIDSLTRKGFLAKMLAKNKTEGHFQELDKRLTDVMRDLSIPAVGLKQYNIANRTYDEMIDCRKFIDENGGLEAVQADEEKLTTLAFNLDCSIDHMRSELIDCLQRQEENTRTMQQSIGAEVQEIQKLMESPTDHFQQIDMRFLSIDKENALGDGGFGIVYRGKYSSEDVAIKTLKNRNFTTQRNDKMLLELRKEVKTLFILGKYPGFVRLYGANFDLGKGELCMVLELADGSLDDFIHTNKMQVDLTFALKTSIAVDIARAMDVLHGLNMILRDLKPQNVFIFMKGREGNQHITAKLADFGLAKGVHSKASTNSRSGNIKGTVPYMPPELFQEAYWNVPYNFGSDVYSLGITLNELMLEERPFHGFDGTEVLLMGRIKEGHTPVLFQSSLNDPLSHKMIESIIKDCVVRDPNARPQMSIVVADLQRVLWAVSGDEPRKDLKNAKKSLRSLDHEECIFLFEHLNITNARAILPRRVTGEDLSLVKTAADLEYIGVKLESDVIPNVLETLLKYRECGIEQSMLDERRSLYVKERALHRGVSPLLIAYEKKDCRLFSILTKECKDIDVALTADGRTALHLAAELGAENSSWFAQCLSLFADLKANVDVKSKNGATAMLYAVENGHQTVVELLLSVRASVFEQNSSGLSPITCAYLAGHRDIVSLLSNKEYEKMPFNALSDDECVALLYSLGCTVSVSETAHGVRFADMLEMFIEEEDCEESEDAFKELGVWKGDVKLSDIITSLQQMRWNGVSKGLFVIRREKIEREARILTIVRRWCAEAKEKNVPPLYLAAEAGDVEGVQALLESTYDMVKNESEDVKQFMSDKVENRINKAGDRKDRFAPLHVAYLNGHTEIVSLLIKHKANVDARDKRRHTPLHIAANKGDSDTVSLFISQRANIEAKDRDQRTPLHISALEGHKEIVSLLISRKANIEARQRDERTPLHISALNGQKEVVSLLISHNAIVDAKDWDESTPLHCAVENGHKEAVSVLLSNKADINAVDEDESTALHISARNGRTEVLSFLISQNANIGAKNFDQRIPLHEAAEKGHKEAVSVLISAKANLEAKDHSGSTAMHLCAKNGHQNVVTLLLSANASATEKDSSGLSPISCASLAGHREIVSLLLNQAYDKVPFNSLSDDECKALLSSLGCTLSGNESAHGVGFANVLEAILDEEDDAEKENALRELGKWEGDAQMRDAIEALSQARESGVSKGMFVLASEKK